MSRLASTRTIAGGYFALEPSATQPCQSAFARAGFGLSAFAAILRSSTPQYSCSTLNSTPTDIAVWTGGKGGVGGSEMIDISSCLGAAIF